MSALSGEFGAYLALVLVGFLRNASACRAMRIAEIVTGTSMTASPNRGTLPAWSLTPVANVLSCTFIWTAPCAWKRFWSSRAWARSSCPPRISRG